MISWENEAFLLPLKEFGDDELEIVVPSVSILAEPPVSLVDKFVDKQVTEGGREGLSRVPLLDGRPGIIAGRDSWPRDAAIARRYSNVFPQLSSLFTDRCGFWRMGEGAKQPISTKVECSMKSIF